MNNLQSSRVQSKSFREMSCVMRQLLPWAHIHRKRGGSGCGGRVWGSGHLTFPSLACTEKKFQLFLPYTRPPPFFGYFLFPSLTQKKIKPLIQSFIPRSPEPAPPNWAAPYFCSLPQSHAAKLCLPPPHPLSFHLLNQPSLHVSCCSAECLLLLDRP